MNRLSFRCVHRYGGGFLLDAAFETSAQVTALVGPSGAGKTSILSMIAGIVRPQRGAIVCGTQVWLDTARPTFVKPQRRRVALVFQDQLLFPHLSVERNLLYGHRRRGSAGPIEPARVIEVLELGELLARYPRNLSGGEKQRVALGRALLSGPELLLMDEPLVALDDDLKHRILTYLERAVAQWHVPTIYVSHNLAEVRRLAEHVVLMEQGRVTACGPAAAVLGDYSPSPGAGL